MNVPESIRDIGERPLGRVLVILVGLCLVFGVMTLFLPIRPLIWWSLPVLLIIWGISTLYRYGVGKSLTLLAGCLLILGGITRALFQLISMSEFIGTVANLVPLAGIFAEMFAHHYRENK
ncbi:hypothetical protein [Haladaptatus salinisoli]|uniref:hypothetical protein n=1 Tax=Haladaptatus salinisoli TaxID=2884876 RepID=UPI001D0A5AA0|nr:hypothetical protein [Haladaptatus salinisoli]